jgi:hypothetical protein
MSIRTIVFWLVTSTERSLVGPCFHNTLTEKNAIHTWHVDSGPHHWAVPRNDLYLIGMMLFRDKK